MKKFLSLVLALIMVTSLFTIQASASAAKDFTDDESITYGEAVDVISAIEVVTGYEDGSFKPTQPLTRGAAAKIITNLILGPATAGNLTCTKAPFPDVPTNHTFAAAIAYCSQNKIINGYSNGFFAPGEPLTGYAFLKMLEGALGYDGNVEGFTGGNWSINVAKIANGIGLTEGLADGFSGTATVDRQTACLFAFNTLKADLVEYAAGTNVAKSVTATTQATSDNNWKNIVNETLNDRQSNRIIQFGERYFPRLVRNEGAFTFNARYGDEARKRPQDSQTPDIWQDNMGRPATNWTWKGQSIGTYAETPAKTYVGSVKINQIYADLGMTSSGAGYLYINGVPYTGSMDTNSNIGKDVSRSNTDKLSSLSEAYCNADKDGDAQSKIGDGTLIEVFRNEKTNEVLIAAMSVYGGKIASEKAGNSVKDDYVVVEAGSRDPFSSNEEGVTRPMSKVLSTPKNAKGEYMWDIESFTDDAHDEYVTTEFKAKDVVGFTFSDKTLEIADMFKIESVTGKLARKEVGTSLTLGDTTYKYSQEASFESGLGSEDNLLNNSEYIVYLDTDGNALWIEEANFNATSYALITRITNEYRNNVYSDYLGNPKDEQKFTIRGRDVADNQGNVKGDTGYSDAWDAHNPIGGKSASSSTSLWDGNRARLLLADGTMRNVTLDKAYLLGGAGEEAIVGGVNGRALKFTAGKVVRYSVDANGDYRLFDESTNDKIDSGIAQDFELTNHKLRNEGKDGNFFKLKNMGEIGGVIKDFTGDNSTIIVARNNEDESYRVYTGVRNAPTIKAGKDDDGNKVPIEAYAYVKDGVAKIVFVPYGDLQNDGKNVTFIAQRSMSDAYLQDDTVDYYIYNAVVKGEIVKIKVAANAESNNSAFTLGEKPKKTSDKVGVIFNSTVTNADDIYTKLNKKDWTGDMSDAGGAKEGIRKVSDTEVRLGTANDQRGALYSFANGAKVYTVTSGGKIEATEIADVETNVRTWNYAVLDDGEISVLFIVEQRDRVD